MKRYLVKDLFKVIFSLTFLLYSSLGYGVELTGQLIKKRNELFLVVGKKLDPSQKLGTYKVQGVDNLKSLKGPLFIKANGEVKKGEFYISSFTPIVYNPLRL